MSQLDDLNAAIKAEDVDVQAIAAVATKIDTDIKALLAKPGLPPDLTTQLQAIQAHTSALGTALTQLQASDTAANPPATPPAA